MPVIMRQSIERSLPSSTQAITGRITLYVCLSPNNQAIVDVASRLLAVLVKSADDS